MPNLTNKTIIIAEIGECYNGNLATARALINNAKKSGCDIVKFQTLDYDNISQFDPEREWFKKIALNPAKIKYLSDYADKIGIQILFSPENIKTAGWLLDAGLKDVKIARSLIADIGLLRFINLKFKKVFLSTGMASLDEVRKAVNSLKDVRGLYILHCISEYPTGPLLKKKGLRALALEDTHLNMMKIIAELFPRYKIGYSDHTSGIFAPLIAVAMGAQVIEKHITLDRTRPVNNYHNGGNYQGTDHILSLEPKELREMVIKIREVERMLGEKKWKRSKGELLLRGFLRKRFSDAKT